MVSKTGMLELVKGLDWRAVDAAIKESPALLAFRDERGRNWLHICCSVEIAKKKIDAKNSMRMAEVLLSHGLGLDQEAFTEGKWKATPVWFSVARGQNPALTEFLLKRKANPNYSLFAAVWNNDLSTINLLARFDAVIDDLSAGETPFLGAIKWSRFPPAEALLKLGADPNHADKNGMTALHYMLKKGSDKTDFEMLARYGARGDIADKKGVTASDLLRRKRDPAFHRIADLLDANSGSAKKRKKA